MLNPTDMIWANVAEIEDLRANVKILKAENELLKKRLGELEKLVGDPSSGGLGSFGEPVIKWARQD